MKVISGLGPRNLRLKNICAAIGIFDGIHRGHVFLLKQMLQTAQRLNAKSMVITFFPHPAHVLRPDLKLSYLVSLKQRLHVFEAMGIDYCLVIKFNKRFAAVDPRKFIEQVLVRKLDVKAIFVGEDFRFGKDRSGDITLFKELAQQCHYEMHAVVPLKQGPQPISSTRIRKAISEGDLKCAEKLLGRSFAIEGTVVAGAGRGRTLGFPTANVKTEAPILLPKGVYAVRMTIGQTAYPAVANIGIRPSFKDKHPSIHLEVHILDFKKNIYGKAVGVEFLQKIRDEKKFNGPQELVAQIHKDILKSRTYLSRILH